MELDKNLSRSPIKSGYNTVENLQRISLRVYQNLVWDSKEILSEKILKIEGAICKRSLMNILQILSEESLVKY